MCRRCYRRAYKKRKHGFCQECGHDLILNRNGLCIPCANGKRTAAYVFPREWEDVLDVDLIRKVHNLDIRTNKRMMA
jgi:hypothetical protein